MFFPNRGIYHLAGFIDMTIVMYSIVKALNVFSNTTIPVINKTKHNKIKIIEVWIIGHKRYIELISDCNRYNDTTIIVVILHYNCI